MEVIGWNEPKFGEEEINEIEKVIKNNYVNEGPKTKELESLISKYLDVKHVVLTTNATAALFLAIKSEALSRGTNDFEVIVPDLTMIATATAVNWAGGKPVFVDIKKEDLTIDTLKIKEKITKKTIAIIPVHIVGRAAEMEKIIGIAKKYNLSVIEDAAGALGSIHNGNFLGTFGNIGCFSLQSNKIITSGQGGIIVTNDDNLYELIRRHRDFGRLNNKEFLHEIVGYNLKFNDLSAALAVAQLKRIEERKNLLIHQFNLYRKLLSELDELKFFEYASGEVPLWVEVKVKDRDNLVKFLNSAGIFPRNCWPALHRNKPYKFQGEDQDFPVASDASDTVLWIPNGPNIKDKDIQKICNLIKSFYKSL